MEPNPNFTYMLYSATAEDSDCHKKNTDVHYSGKRYTESADINCLRNSTTANSTKPNICKVMLFYYS